MFWKMLGADFLLVTMLAVAYPAPVTTRLLLVLLAILVVSVVLNMTLTPHHRGPPAPDGGDKV
jgi:hypothetical protein